MHESEIGIINIEKSHCKKLLGIKTDNNLDEIIKKASPEVSALYKIFLSWTQRQDGFHSSFHKSLTVLLSGCLIVEPVITKHFMEDIYR